MSKTIITSPRKMQSEALARYIKTSMLKSFAELKPYIEELWTRFDALKDGETIAGCTTRKEYCENVLNRTPRAVRYMLHGGNPANSQRPALPARGEIISPPSYVAGDVATKNVGPEVLPETSPESEPEPKRHAPTPTEKHAKELEVFVQKYFCEAHVVVCRRLPEVNNRFFDLMNVNAVEASVIKKMVLAGNKEEQRLLKERLKSAAKKRQS